ncbi:hypothetical protein Q3G72_014649 [Acer saccharum]|nr:hypothetical protein Q3G72_014649 [Acer saccharum]
MNSDSLEEEEGLEHDRRMDFSSEVDVSEVEEVENCAGSVAGDGEDEVVVVNSARRIAGDSEEELVRATIVVERKPAGRSKRKSAMVEKKVANIIEMGTAIGFDFKEADKEVREAIAIREEEDDARFIDRYGQ